MLINVNYSLEDAAKEDKKDKIVVPVLDPKHFEFNDFDDVLSKLKQLPTGEILTYMLLSM